MGDSLEAQGYKIEALRVYIQVFMIDGKYHQEEIGFQEWISLDIQNLGRMLKVVGVSQFETVWREVTGEEWPEELRSTIQAASEGNQE